MDSIGAVAMFRLPRTSLAAMRTAGGTGDCRLIHYRKVVELNPNYATRSTSGLPLLAIVSHSISPEFANSRPTRLAPEPSADDHHGWAYYTRALTTVSGSTSGCGRCTAECQRLITWPWCTIIAWLPSALPHRIPPSPPPPPSRPQDGPHSRPDATATER